MKPEFVDNIADNTMATAIRDFLDHLHETLKKPIHLCIASGYFNPGGFSLLADKLARLEKIRLLIGAEPVPPPAIPLRMPGDPKGARFERKLVDAALGSHAQGLARDRDLAPFAPEQDAALRRLVEFLRSGHVEVRRYEKAFLHGKCYLFGAEDGTLVGSSNFTFAGLTQNLELNLGDYQPHVVQQVSDWFERLWAESAPYDLAALYEARVASHAPWIVYLRMLYELFGADLAEAAADSDLRLTAFQRDGVSRAERILDKYGGVLIADEVGLGKTFVAGELIRRRLRDRRQRVLVVAPATLRDGPWAAFLERYKLNDAQVISFEQLQRDYRLGAGGEEAHLKQDPNQYALVVIDEAQAVRNPDARRSRALHNLLRGTPKKDLVVMTATPVNNSVWDLYELLRYFLHDAELANQGVLSLERLFRNVAAQNPEDLAPDSLFEVIDATTVRRTRHFIKRYYPNETVRAPDGVDVHIHFPKPTVLAVNYDLDRALPGLFDRIRDALAPLSGQPTLKLARYAPDDYRRQSAPVNASTAALIGLVRTGILKRFESSAFAFVETLKKLERGCEAFLKGLSEGKVLRGRGLAEIEDLSDTDSWAELIADGEWEEAAAYKVRELREAVEADRSVFAELVEIAEPLTALDNPKLQALDKELAKIAREAGRNNGDRRKVLIFTFFEDTADWIYRHLIAATESSRDLAAYRGRVAAVGGSRTFGEVPREDAIFGFTPVSMEAPANKRADRFDVLVTTDILAEGMNLQQCRHIINFDLPWNPMRLVQRHGRVDRIGSPHDEIFLRCFFPDQRLDALLTLETTLRSKLAQAAATIGLSNEVIPGSAVVEKAFAETREEIEQLRRGEAALFEAGGERGGAQSGEEYRHELKKALEEPAIREQVLLLPGAAGSARATDGEAGYIFCAKIGDRTFLRFVPAAGGPIATDVLGCLKRAACLKSEPALDSPALWHGAYAAWAQARDGIHREWMHATDPANVQPKIPEVARRAAEHLRRHPPADIAQERIRQSVEALEAPLDGRLQRAIREVLDAPKRAPAETSLRLLELVDALGLEPYRAPKPFPEIEPQEIRLVCWMALTPRAMAPPARSTNGPSAPTYGAAP